MKLFVCVDKNNGLLFGNRRQSMDRAVRQKMLALIGDKPLYLNTYSAGQFENQERLIVSDGFLEQMTADDYCFMESNSIDTALFEEVYVFNWNRNYPGDTFLQLDAAFQKVSAENFAGNSHEKITLTVYRKNPSC